MALSVVGVTAPEADGVLSSFSVMVEVDGDRAKGLRVPKWVSLSSVAMVSIWSERDSNGWRREVLHDQQKGGTSIPQAWNALEEILTLSELPRHGSYHGVDISTRRGRTRSVSRCRECKTESESWSGGKGILLRSPSRRNRGRVESSATSWSEKVKGLQTSRVADGGRQRRRRGWNTSWTE